MPGEGNLSERRSFLKRFIVPAGIMLAAMLGSWIIYVNSLRIPNQHVGQTVAFVAAIPLWISIGFGTFLVYPMSFFRGASAWERTLASLVTPLAWTIKEIVRATHYFPLGESIYFGFHQIFLLAFAGAFLEMGLCETICRWRLNRRGEEQVRIISTGPLTAIIGGAAGLYVLFFWGWGVNFFYFYMEVYKVLFK